MKEFARKFEYFGVRDGEKLGAFLLTIGSDNTLSLKILEGQAAITTGLFIAALVRLMKAYEIAYGEITRPVREWPIRFISCTDPCFVSSSIVLEEERDRGYPIKRVITTHTLCAVYLGSHLDIYDLLDSLLASSVIRCDEGGYYQLPDDRDGFEESLVLIEPRDISQEPGWVQPGEIPRLVSHDDDWEE